MPAGIGSDQQNLVRICRCIQRNELEESTGLGLYALSATLVDKAEASEALKANLVWSAGLEAPSISSLQLNDFRSGEQLRQEVDVKAEKGRIS